MNLLTNQMSSLGQQQQQLQFGNVPGATPTQPMSTPLRPPTVNATPFCSPTGYGLFGSGNMHQTSATNNSGGNQLPRINESQGGNSSSSSMNIDEEQVAEMLNNPNRIRFPDNNS